MRVSKEATARVKLVCCMAVWGTISLFVRGIALSSGEISLWRAVVALLVIFIYKKICRQRIPLSAIKKELPLLCFSGAAMGANWILLFEAYRYTTVSLATLSYYFAPAMLMIACPLLFHERMTRRQIVCFLAATAGMILVIGMGGASGKPGQFRGIALGLGAALLYATVVLSNKKIAGVSGIDRTLFQFLTAAAVLLPYVLLTSGVHVTQLDGKGLLNLVVLGTVHTGLCYCVYFSVVSTLAGQETAILSYVDPLVAICMSVLFFQESITVLQVVGGVLILGCTLYNELAGNRVCLNEVSTAKRE